MEQNQIEQKYQEIRNLVSNHVTIERAILYLMDFASDICNNENKDEIIDDCIVFKTRYSKCSDDIDQLCLIGKGILGFTRDLIKQYKIDNEA